MVDIQQDIQSLIPQDDMEGSQGVDISWLHYPQKDGQVRKSTPTAQETIEISPMISKEAENAVDVPMSSSTPELKLHGLSDSHSNANHRPHLHTRKSAETMTTPSPKSTRDARSQSPSMGRKLSWISNLSSKFSSSPQSSPTPPTTAGKPVPTVSPEPVNGREPETGSPQHLRPDPLSSSPKSGQPSFLQSAFRRFSVSSMNSANNGKVVANGGICPRRVMNVDPFRERCRIEDLQPAKLRRVSFCVDVEIAGTARYREEKAEDRPSEGTTSLHDLVEAKRGPDPESKERSEAEALKNPEMPVENQDESNTSNNVDGIVAAGKIHVEPESPPVNGEVKETSRKKEKKKRSEEERRERKERKRQNSIANGQVPVEISRESSSETSLPDGVPPSRVQDRPTTDPLRVYKRCCQLRETTVLKRITDQLSSPTATDSLSTGTISSLDLTGFWMSLADVTTFGDYLAVVPVRKLVLEDCNLTDEAVRIILAGLLAVKTPDQAKFNKHLNRQHHHEVEKAEQLGVIERLSFKNNPKIGRDGWKHIGYFVNMSRSLKALDLSMLEFPKFKPPTNGVKVPKGVVDISIVFQQCLAERLAGDRLEELVLSDCKLTTLHIERIVDAVKRSGVTRLGLASNQLSRAGLQHVADYVRLGHCEGLDLGGNDLSEDLNMLAEAFDNGGNALYALSLADCNLSPAALQTLFPSLTTLSNFRFIDLSHNHGLFNTQPDALGILRKYLPRCNALKRIHLADVDMSSEHAIALAEVLPEVANLAHFSILENPQLTALASAKEEASQEEACALYASLMTAVRVSRCIVCIDIDTPTRESSEIIKALAQQVVAYSLRNMERLPLHEGSLSGTHSVLTEKVEVPDVLLHIVGHMEGYPDLQDDEPAPDDDYIVGGTGVVKALGVCLGNKAFDHRASTSHTPSVSGTGTPKKAFQGVQVASKAREMSKNLLGSARKIRARLQPALANEEIHHNELAYRRLLFLDSTLERMIQRFEDEYPECRLEPRLPDPSTPLIITDDEPSPSPSSLNPLPTANTSIDADSINEHPLTSIRTPLMRRDSDVSLASRFLGQEEGRMHRIGQNIRREILRPQSLDFLHGTTGDETDSAAVSELRCKLEGLEGPVLRECLEKVGPEELVRRYGGGEEQLLRLRKEDPEGFERFMESQDKVMANLRLGKGEDEELRERRKTMEKEHGETPKEEQGKILNDEEVVTWLGKDST